jgi:hypothetical protein
MKQLEIATAELAAREAQREALHAAQLAAREAEQAELAARAQLAAREALHAEREALHAEREALHAAQLAAREAEREALHAAQLAAREAEREALHAAQLAAREAELEALHAAQLAEREALHAAEKQRLETQLASHGSPGGCSLMPKARPGRVMGGLIREFAIVKAIGSPSKSEAAVLQPMLADFSVNATPLTPSLSGLGQASSLAALAALKVPVHDLLREQRMYGIAATFVPPWIGVTSTAEARGGKTASTLYNMPIANRPSLPGFTLSWNCQPDLLTHVRDAERHAAYVGECKSMASAGDKAESSKLFDQLATYMMLGMCAVNFKADATLPGGHRRFYTAPPIGYGLATAGPLGFLIAGEWVGKLHLSIVSQPFFLGSPEHAVAVAALPDAPDADVYHFPMDDPAAALLRWPSAAEQPAAGAGAARSPAANPLVVWTSSPMRSRERPDVERFCKVVFCAAQDAAYFRRMYLVYAALSAARRSAAAGSPPPPSLVDAQLLFGASEVCVCMPWVRGREATDTDLEDGGVVAALASAIHWLAQHKLIYVDVRPPNVMIDDAVRADGGGGGDAGGEVGHVAVHGGAGSSGDSCGDAGIRAAGGGSSLAAGGVILVDYDDMALVDAPPASFETFHLAVRAALPAEYLAEHGSFIERMPALKAALQAMPWT